MKGFLGDFKNFIMKGNVINMAVGIIIGAAFGKIITSLVDNIITPLLSMLFNSGEISNWVLHLGEDGNVVLRYGVFLQNIIDFVLIAFSIFVVLRFIINRRKTTEEEESKKSDEIIILEEIRDELRK